MGLSARLSCTFGSGFPWRLVTNEPSVDAYRGTATHSIKLCTPPHLLGTLGLKSISFSATDLPSVERDCLDLLLCFITNSFVSFIEAIRTLSREPQVPLKLWTSIKTSTLSVMTAASSAVQKCCPDIFSAETRDSLATLCSECQSLPSPLV